jgi:hypothetical protein
MEPAAVAVALTASYLSHFIIIRHPKRDWIGVTEPNLILSNELENLLVRNRILISNHKKFCSAPLMSSRIWDNLVLSSRF